MTEDLKSALLSFYEKCETFYHYNLEINESISTNSLNFDRHFTTWGYTEFALKRFGWRISGGRIMFEGEKLYYEIAADRITEFVEKEKNKFELLEKYSETVYRKTILTFIHP